MASSGEAVPVAEVAGPQRSAGAAPPTWVIGLKLGRTEAAVSSKAAEQHVRLKPTNQSPYGTK